MRSKGVLTLALLKIEALPVFTCDFVIDSERLYAMASDTVLAFYGKLYTWEINLKELACEQMVGAQIVIGTPYRYHCSN